MTAVSADPGRYDVIEGAWTLIGTACAVCATVVFGTHAACLRCGSTSIRRVPVAGEGEVLSYTTVHRPAREWRGQVPYTLVEAQTSDGVVVVAPVDAASEGRVAIGRPVRAGTAFVPSPAGPDVAVYQWSVRP
jgi:uncharacterized OB-fold protein